MFKGNLKEYRKKQTVVQRSTTVRFGDDETKLADMAVQKSKYGEFEEPLVSDPTATTEQDSHPLIEAPKPKPAIAGGLGAQFLKNAMANKMNDMIKKYHDTTNRLYKDIESYEEEEDVEEATGNDDDRDMDQLLDQEHADNEEENQNMFSDDDLETNETL